MPSIAQVTLSLLLGAMAGYIVGRTGFSTEARDSLACVAGLATALLVLLARVMRFFLATHDGHGSFVGFGNIVVLGAALGTALILAVALHFALASSSAHSRAAVLGAVSAAIFGWALAAQYWEAV